MSVLRPFEQATKALEGRAENGQHGTIGEVLPALLGLKSHLVSCYNQFKRRQEKDEEEHLTTAFHVLETSINNGLDHMDKYIAITSEIPVYLAAVVLDPRLKWESLENMAKREHPTTSGFTEWVQNAKFLVQRLWEQ
ncbi:hypothetical protein FN846DRAFT_771499, partial [Sphaerosporella brunnea]